MGLARRFGKTDWLDLGLRALGDEGPSGLTVESLCERASRTRGSFYHHFPDMNDFLTRLVAHWHARFTSDVIDKTESSHTKLAALNEFASRLDPAVELGMRRLANQQSAVASAVDAVDQDRMNYLARLYRRAGLSRTAATRVAKLEYAGYVGSQLLWPDASAKERESLGRLLGKMTSRYFELHE